MAARKQSDTAKLMVRMKEPLRARLEKAAKMNGVSMNAELNHRLESSLSEVETFGGRHIYVTARMVADAIAMTEIQTGGRWLGNEETSRKAVESVYGVLQTMIANKLEGKS